MFEVDEMIKQGLATIILSIYKVEKYIYRMYVQGRRIS